MCKRRPFVVRTYTRIVVLVFFLGFAARFFVNIVGIKWLDGFVGIFAGLFFLSLTLPLIFLKQWVGTKWTSNRIRAIILSGLARLLALPLMLVSVYLIYMGSTEIWIVLFKAA